jgi:D-arabinose 1-dehydrogenase-like Zn-dependent alcohol dehydrogenase
MSKTTTTTLQNPAVYLHAAGKAEIADSPYPTISDPHDVVLKIAYVGVCGSDVCFIRPSVFLSLLAHPPTPLPYE